MCLKEIMTKIVELSTGICRLLVSVECRVKLQYGKANEFLKICQISEHVDTSKLNLPGN
jgi:hypothetical protein